MTTDPFTAPNVWAMAADMLAPRDAGSGNEWYLPNPDPSVTDEGKFLRDNVSGAPVLDAATGLPLIRGRARPKQRPPRGPWFVWLLMSGRGFGKSRTGNEWLDNEARNGRPGEQFLLAGRTPSDVKIYELYGPGGILTHHPDVRYEPANRELVWPNGVRAIIRSGANPEEFRGFSGRRALLAEFAAWQYARECWDNLIFGMREGRDPQVVINTTPRPIQVVRDIIAMPSTVLTTGSSYENAPNLARVWVENVLDPLRGTRLGRQEIEAEMLEEIEGALWRLSDIDSGRVARDDVPDLVRIATGVDPQGVKGPGSETGIVCAGVDANGTLYVLDDASLNGTPLEWGTRVIATHNRHEGDLVVAEKNFGGDMVEQTLRAVDDRVKFKMVTASRGKRQRAEPVAALYERGKVRHVGSFPSLEDEMCSFTPESDRSPNRMDALVWAITELALVEQARPAPRMATWGRRRTA